MSLTRTPGHPVSGSILAALADVDAAPAGWVSPSVVLHVHLPAETNASSQAASRRLLDAHVRVVGGSAGPSGERILMAAGSPEQWTKIAAFVTGRGTARAVADVRAPSVAEVVRTRPTPAAVPGVWSATLHPDLCGAPVHAGPACSEQLEAFAAAVAQVGGVAHLTRVGT